MGNCGHYTRSSLDLDLCKVKNHVDLSIKYNRFIYDLEYHGRDIYLQVPSSWWNASLRKSEFASYDLHEYDPESILVNLHYDTDAGYRSYTLSNILDDIEEYMDCWMKGGLTVISHNIHFVYIDGLYADRHKIRLTELVDHEAHQPPELSDKFQSVSLMKTVEYDCSESIETRLAGFTKPKQFVHFHYASSMKAFRSWVFDQLMRKLVSGKFMSCIFWIASKSRLLITIVIFKIYKK